MFVCLPTRLVAPRGAGVMLVFLLYTRPGPSKQEVLQIASEWMLLTSLRVFRVSASVLGVRGSQVKKAGTCREELS